MDLKFIIERVKGIISIPAKEWKIIQNEIVDRNDLIKKYALPLIGVGALFTLGGTALFGTYSLLYTFLNAISVFVTYFLGMYISAFAINEIAPSFGSRKDINVSFKLVIYSSTAIYLAIIVSGIHPDIFGFVKIFYFYSIYLFWLGITPMLHTPEDKKLGFVIVSILIFVVVNNLIKLILTKMIPIY
ncbi:MAG: DUF1282 family protein [Bacteroidetes bacterium]|jgi:hypothetical protein|nr:DUF1282 family protein [Bacteroidota bacterium]MBT6686771.1 DUF1282 family protein [Bacteroidota bacterium]MBT7141990.1 DUF1282 family protein [Bacteroidota bacterium]MBT7492500.1 DUF1282 family protein [Bacteroidota bacterium]